MPELHIDNSTIKSLVCEACWNSLFTFDSFQIALDPRSKGFSYTATCESIRASAEQGCNWCKLFVKKKARGQCDIALSCEEDSDRETQAFTPAGTKKFTLRTQAKDANVPSSYSFRMYTTADDNASNFIAARDRVLQVAALSNYKLASECFNNCIRSHSQCPKPRQSPLPDRVIDCSNTERPKIVLTDGAQGAYITLSYVWGEQQPITTTENIDSYVKDGLEMEKFPKTIRDAVLSAHNLGIRYLWIDALCILQDSTEDKIRQIGRMNAYTETPCASKVSEGFLQDRPARIPSAHIPFICPDGKVGTVYLAAASIEGYDATRGYHDEMEPVNFRGWCLQERVLSERCFIFASDTLKYYCQTETVNIGDALCEPTTGERLPRAVFLPGHPSTLSSDDLVLSRRSWLFAIWEYSRRGLTVGTDKLVALAGIAEQFHRVWQASYLAGLWEHTLLEDLLWDIYVAGKLGPRPAEYRAPSWSWASIDGHATPKNFETKLKPGAYDIGKCEVVECEVTLASEELPFAGVTAAHLKLNGYLHEAKFEFGDPRSSLPKLFVRTDAPSEFKDMGFRHLDSEENVEAVAKAWIFPILWDKKHTFMDGLILASSEGGCFRRIGYIGHSGKPQDLTWVDNGERQIITMV
ncbi:hypothetical protein BDZ97DRAFT_1818243 [Flammula alnicola]|nr:hypothetical protein BDZ97DRAFT_1818243 [Flammula alnicola]